MEQFRKAFREKDGNQIVSYLYFLLVTIAVPLYLEDHYFNVIEAKNHVFMAGAAVLFLLFCCFLFLKKSSFPKKLIPLEKLLIAFALIALVSALLSEHPLEALSGVRGFGVGALPIALLVFFILILANNHWNPEDLWPLVCAVHIFIFFLTILNSAEIDPFSLHEGIYLSQLYFYVSTLGNVNWLVGYLCLLTPLLLFRYFREEKGTNSVLNLITLILAIANMVLCSSDVLFLSVGVFAFFFLPYLFADVRRLRKCAALLTVYGIMIITVMHMDAFRYKVAGFKDLIGFIYRSPLPYLLVIGGIAALWYLRKTEEVNPAVSRWIVRIVRIAITLCALYFVFDLSRAIINQNLKWGNKRLWLWKDSFYSFFHRFTPLQKLIGVGPELLDYWYVEVSKEITAHYNSAHSEWIQTLLTMGVAGALVYLLICGGILLEYFRKGRKNSAALPYFLALSAYLASGLVNSANVTNTALMSVILALYLREVKKEVKQNEKEN